MQGHMEQAMPIIELYESFKVLLGGEAPPPSLGPDSFPHCQSTLFNFFVNRVGVQIKHSL